MDAGKPSGAERSRILDPPCTKPHMCNALKRDNSGKHLHGAPLVRAFLWPSEPPPHVVDGGRTLRLEHRGEALVRAAHHVDALHKVGERRGERRVGGA